jgi:hypothetical protein
MERVQRKPMVNTINLTLVHSYRDQHRHESSFKNAAEEPVINQKDFTEYLERKRKYDLRLSYAMVI